MAAGRRVLCPGPRDPIPRHFPTLQAKLFNSSEGTIRGAVPAGTAPRSALLP